MNKRLPRLVSALGLAAAVLLLPGCANYQLGSMLPAGVKSVYVPTFVNRTNEPLLESETTRAVIEQIQLDGSLKLADKDQADSILEVTLVDFRMDPLRYDTQRRTQATEYRMSITASVVLKRRSDDKVLVEEPRVMGEKDFTFTSDLTSSKRQFLPDAAQDLGHDITEKIVEAWQ